VIRPDLVDCWIYRDAVVPGVDAQGDAQGGLTRTPGTRAAAPAPSAREVLLLRRAPGRILAGLWQCVSGSLEPGERVAAGALRELREETGFGPDDIDGFYDLDLINQFHEPSVDAVLVAAVFAVRVRPGSELVISHEHDQARWVPVDSAASQLVWPGYREAVARIAHDLRDPDRAGWFELTLDGQRVPR
jgi:8-oxo-dGTP diphosphatase